MSSSTSHPGIQGHLGTQSQKKVRKKHSKNKEALIGKGGNKYNKGPYKIKVSYKRSKSAPPIGENKDPIKQILKEMNYYAASSLNMRDSLNKNLWNDDSRVLLPEVSAALERIAKDFFDSLVLPEDQKLIDIKFTGSLANYNWTEKSDIDLHLVLDFDSISTNKKRLRDYMSSKKTVWNKNHDIMIAGHEVEIYVEDMKEMHYASGVYSISNGEWIVSPNKKRPIVDQRQISIKMNKIQEKVQVLFDLFNKQDYTSCFMQVESFLEKLSNMRVSGLEVGGEFSIENLVYKNLRKLGTIQDLYDLKYDAYDKKMEQLTKQDRKPPYSVYTR